MERCQISKDFWTGCAMQLNWPYKNVGRLVSRDNEVKLIETEEGLSLSIYTILLQKRFFPFTLNTIGYFGRLLMPQGCGKTRKITGSISTDWVNSSGIKQMDDWYSVSQDILEDNGGGGLINATITLDPLYKRSQNVYPEHAVVVLESLHISPLGYWEKSNQGFSLIGGKQLGYKNMDDWYKVYTRKISLITEETDHRFNYYNKSPSQALQSVYPSIKWLLMEIQGGSFVGWKKVMNDPIQQRKS